MISCGLVFLLAMASIKTAKNLMEIEKETHVALKVSKSKADFLANMSHEIRTPINAVIGMNEMIRRGEISKKYWAVVENRPQAESGELIHYILRDGKSNRSYCYNAPKGDAKRAALRYAVLGASERYTLVEVELLTGRHHQIRAQLSKIGCPIKGDLKYGAKRSNPNGGISLHSRTMSFIHPVRKEQVTIEAPVPTDDNLWLFFAQSQAGL